MKFSQIALLAVILAGVAKATSIPGYEGFVDKYSTVTCDKYYYSSESDCTSDIDAFYTIDAFYEFEEGSGNLSWIDETTIAELDSDGNIVDEIFFLDTCEGPDEDGDFSSIECVSECDNLCTARGATDLAAAIAAATSVPSASTDDDDDYVYTAPTDDYDDYVYTPPTDAEIESNAGTVVTVILLIIAVGGAIGAGVKQYQAKKLQEEADKLKKEAEEQGETEMTPAAAVP